MQNEGKEKILNYLPNLTGMSFADWLIDMSIDSLFRRFEFTLKKIMLHNIYSVEEHISC